MGTLDLFALKSSLRWRIWLQGAPIDSPLGGGVMGDRPEQAEVLDLRDFALRIATVFALVVGSLAFLLVV